MGFNDPWMSKMPYYKRKDSAMEEAKRAEFVGKLSETIETLISMGNGKIVTQSLKATITAYYVGKMLRLDIRAKEQKENGEEP